MYETRRQKTEQQAPPALRTRGRPRRLGNRDADRGNRRRPVRAQRPGSHDQRSHRVRPTRHGQPDARPGARREPACPAIYKVWSRDYEGEYTVIYEIDAATMKPAATTRRRK